MIQQLYTDTQAEFLRMLAEEKLREGITPMGGMYNRNIIVRDPLHNQDVNVRIPIVPGERVPHLWRSNLHEGVIYNALTQCFGSEQMPTLLYTAPGGTFHIQKVETDVQPFPPEGQPIPEHLIGELAEFWQRTQQLQLFLGRREISAYDNAIFWKPSFRERGASPLAFRAPQTWEEYCTVAKLDVQTHHDRLCVDHSDLLKNLGFPPNLDGALAGALAPLSAGKLAPTHPDMGRGNLGIKENHLFVWDPELIGVHDPRHSVAFLLGTGKYPEQQYHALLDAHCQRASEEQQPSFVHDVQCWEKYFALSDAVRCVFLAVSDTYRYDLSGYAHPHDTVTAWSEKLTDRIRAALPLWGGGSTELDATSVEAAFEQHVLPRVDKRTGVDLRYKLGIWGDAAGVRSEAYLRRRKTTPSQPKQ